MDWEPDKLAIVGGKRLSGSINAAGNKHSMVLAIAAAVATRASLVLYNVPNIVETRVLGQLVADLGLEVSTAPPVLGIRGQIASSWIDPDRSKSIHGSCYLLPAILAARGEVSFPGAGGDDLGDFDWGLSRPLRHMFEVMEQFGVRWQLDRDRVVVAKATKLRGTRLDIMRWSSDPTLLNGPRVSGATKTAVLMAAVSDGETIIDNPHIQGATIELLNVVVAMGCEVERDERRWVICGVRSGGNVRYVLEADPVEVIFWQTLAALTGSEFRVSVGERAPLISTLRHELALLDRLGITPTFDGSTMVTTLPKSPYSGHGLVAQSTGISTDALPFLVCLMFRATTPSSAVDLVWPGRFQYARELRKLGLDSRLRNDLLSITPSMTRPTAEWLRPADTRSAASCVLFGLATDGESRIAGAHHVYRGHDRFLQKLRSVGAEVYPS